MSEYNVSVSGGVQDLNVPLHGHLGVELRQYPVIPNPEGEPTEEMTKMGIDGVIYEVVDNEARETLPTKVDKEEGKGLSENDFTNTLKDKLDGIETNATHTEVDTEISATSTNPVESKAIYNLLNDLLPEATATGNPISISNASGFNAKSLKVELEPIQDLNGYDKPWAGGNGKNKCDNSTLLVGYYDDQGRYQYQTSYRTSDLIPVKASTQYTNSFFDKSKTRVGGLVTTFWDSEENIISQSTSESYTTTSETAYIRVRSFQNQASYVNNDDYLFQVEEGSTPTSYAPYENNCPISGRTQTTVKRCGFNIWDEVWEVGSIDATTGNDRIDDTVIRSKNYFELLPNTDYYFYAGSIGSPYNVRSRYYDKNKNYIGTGNIIIFNTVFTPPSNARYMRFALQTQYGTTYKNDICVNISDTAKNGTYEPYVTPVDTTIQFGQTVYGGEVDVTNGGTSTKYGKTSFKLSQNTASTAIGSTITRYAFSASSLGITINASLRTSSLCSITVYDPNFVGEFTHFMMNTTATYIYIFVSNDTPMTTDVEICYPLATPITINTPANEISLLKGANTLVADGDMELKYSKLPQ